MTVPWLAWFSILAGFVGLVWSADRFVGGSAAIAYRLGAPKLVVGLTLVAFGTSAPEVVVSVNASLKEAGELAVGNAIGSNLANLGLVLAITALIAPLPIQRHLLTREMPSLVVITGLAGAALYDGALTPWEGGLMLLLLPAVLAMLALGRRADTGELTPELPAYRTTTAVVWFLLGLGVMIGSSELLVWGASEVAIALGVSPLIVGLTVIAIGTSLPELAASVASALKGHQDLALGNIIGSNMFNLLAVMAIPGLIQSPKMESSVFFRDYLAMASITAMLALAVAVDYHWRRRAGRDGHLGRFIGTVLLLSYGAYYTWLFNSV